MIVNVFNQQKELNISVKDVQALTRHVISEERQTCDEVNLYFVDTSVICKLHKDFFDDHSPTDCISFPMDDEDHEDEVSYRILGEVFVCPATAKEYTTKHSGNPYEEITLYIIHGLLHLMGYDDIDEADRSLMREAETRHIESLKKKGLSLSLV